MGNAVLAAGTVVYHGTDCDEFDEENDSLEGPAWVTTSKTVATHFATRQGGWGGTPRVITYKLAEDVELPEISSQRGMAAFCSEHGIDTSGVEEMRETVENAGIAGWVIPNNYPDGDDILLADTSSLDYVSSEPCARPQEHQHGGG